MTCRPPVRQEFRLSEACQHEAQPRSYCQDNPSPTPGRAKKLGESLGRQGTQVLRVPDRLGQRRQKGPGGNVTYRVSQQVGRTADAKKHHAKDGIRTRASEEIGALNRRLRPTRPPPHMISSSSDMDKSP